MCNEKPKGCPEAMINNLNKEDIQVTENQTVL